MFLSKKMEELQETLLEVSSYSANSLFDNKNGL